VAILTKNASILPATRYTSGDGGCNLYFQGPAFTPPLEVDVMVDAAGFKPWCSADAPILFGKVDVDVQVSLESFKRPVQPPRHGSTGTPLPPFPPGSYDRTLPWTPPKSRDFLRADAWGVPVPGLPSVPRGSTEHPERFLTYLDYKYSRDWLRRGLDAHAVRRYTHWVRSWPDARDDGGQSIDQFVADCLFIKQRIPYVICFLGSKDFDPRDQSAAQWIDRVGPALDALLAADAVDELVPAWETDLFNLPGPQTIAYARQVGQKAHAAGKSCWLHFSAQKTSWFADGDSRGRFGFYDDLGTDVDGLLYQAVATWTIGELQARIVDTLTQFGRQGQRHKMRLFERGASLSFAHDHPTEDEENLMGFLACCTRGAAPLWGFGNGARMPDGSPL